jgi:hypothetical protein
MRANGISVIGCDQVRAVVALLVVQSMQFSLGFQHNRNQPKLKLLFILRIPLDWRLVAQSVPDGAASELSLIFGQLKLVGEPYLTPCGW